MKRKKSIAFILQLIVFFILVFQSYYKLSAQADFKAIFSTLHLEPWGRIVIGFLELIIALLLILPRAHFLGMLLSIGMITSVLIAHLFILGPEVDQQKGNLLVNALVIFFSNIIYFFLYKSKLDRFISGLKKGKIQLFLRVKPKNKHKKKTLENQ